MTKQRLGMVSLSPTRLVFFRGSPDFCAGLDAGEIGPTLRACRGGRKCAYSRHLSLIYEKVFFSVAQSVKGAQGFARSPKRSEDPLQRGRTSALAGEGKGTGNVSQRKTPTPVKEPRLPARHQEAAVAGFAGFFLRTSLRIDRARTSQTRTFTGT